MIGWALRVLVIWSVVGLLVYVFIGERLTSLTDLSAPLPAASRAPPPGTVTARPNTLVYRANSQGHVILEGAANGTPVRFLVDTGATLVALTAKDAEAAGISRSDLVFNHNVSTANGVARVASIRLRELRVGQFSVPDVPAVVVEQLNISLLGQSFLKRLDSYEMRDGMLTLNWN